MSDLYNAVKQFSSIFRGYSESDWADKLNYLWTSSLLIIFALLTSTSALTRSQIQCWIPGHLKDFTEYIKDTCWITNTYWVPFDEPIPDSPATDIKVLQREDRELNYYQWVPLLLLVQAFITYFPRFIWRIAKSISGFDMKKLVLLAVEANTSQDRDAKIKLLQTQLDLNIDRLRREKSKKSISNLICPCISRAEGHFLFPCYIGTKILFLLNSLFQFLVINTLLAQHNWFYGFEVVQRITTDSNAWRQSGLFPLVTLCDFVIRVMGNRQRHTVQCVLPQNMVNEKIYIVIYFWLLLLMILTTLNIFAWLYSMGPVMNRQREIKMDLISMELYKTDRDESYFRSFISNYLRVDGVFVLQTIRKSAGELTTIKLLEGLFIRHRERVRAASNIIKMSGNGKSGNGRTHATPSPSRTASRLDGPPQRSDKRKPDHSIADKID